MIMTITLIKKCYFYLFDDYCWKKMMDADLQILRYIFAGQPVVEVTQIPSPQPTDPSQY